MSHPNPLFDELYEDDMNYDDYNDFHEDEMELDDHEDEYEDYYDENDDSMDGDAESAFGSCGWDVDEYYNDTPMYDDYYGGE